MNDDELSSLLTRTDAAGVRRLLTTLGFPAPLRAAARPALLPRGVRTLHVSRRDHLCAVVIRHRATCGGDDLRQIVRALGNADPLSHQLFVIVEPRGRRIVFACDALHDGARHLTVETERVRASDIETLKELLPVSGEGDTAAALRIMKALDRSRVSDRFFRDVTSCRDLIARSWTGIPADTIAEREALALLLISRLVFLYFLQRRGLLAGDASFLPQVLAARQRLPSLNSTTTFYATTLRTIFFGVLNRRPEQRSARARRLGELPYLNGGLFERHITERRRARLDLPDAVLARVFAELLEKYRFTATESDDRVQGGGIDPEMLGRLFEGLMPAGKRARTGTFYTPAAVVERLTEDTLAEHLGGVTGVEPSTVTRLLSADVPAAPATADAARLSETAARLRVLDPACGSGAFLLGALGALVRLRIALDPGVPAVSARREIVANALYGVDLLGDAALICSLRLWLSLVPDCTRVADVPPLPNLDRRMRQGDALIDPLDIGAHAQPPALRPLLRTLVPAAGRYLTAEPASRAKLRRELDRLERLLARTWLDTINDAVNRQARELSARAGDRDLFGEPAAYALAARRALPSLDKRRSALTAFRRDLASTRALPFFSFRVHFAEVEDGFDVVLSNPPWVRSHNWPPTLRETLRERYTVCAEAGWPHAAQLSGLPHASGTQVDLSLLFLERAIRLLAPGGTLGMLLPAKLIRSLYAGGARALLLRSMRVVSIEDHSLDQRAIFKADAFTTAVIAQRTSDDADAGEANVRVCLEHPRRDALRFEVAARCLPLVFGDDRAPWLLAPPACAAALRTMQERARSIGAHGLPVRRGAMTGANDVMLVREVEPKIGDLAHIRTEGYRRAPTAASRRRFAGHVEASVLRPALRGTDVHAWKVAPEVHVIWSPRNDDALAMTPRRVTRFLYRHRETLGRTGAGTGDRLGTLQRLNEHTLGHKVVWSDLGTDLRAAAVQPLVRAVTGCTVPVVPLNTVYFLATSSFRESLLLAAYLNSLPLRTFARAIAERAKDAHFRFFAWTVAVLPLPEDWRSGPRASALLEISTQAHADGHLDAAGRARLDELVCAGFGLSDSDRDALASFDAWLTGHDTERIA